MCVCVFGQRHIKELQVCTHKHSARMWLSLDCLFGNGYTALVLLLEYSLTCSIFWDLRLNASLNTLSRFWWAPFTSRSKVQADRFRKRRSIFSASNRNLILYSALIISLNLCSSSFLKCRCCRFQVKQTICEPPSFARTQPQRRSRLDSPVYNQNHKLNTLIRQVTAVSDSRSRESGVHVWRPLAPNLLAQTYL